MIGTPGGEIGLGLFVVQVFCEIASVTSWAFAGAGRPGAPHRPGPVRPGRSGTVRRPPRPRPGGRDESQALQGIEQVAVIGLRPPGSFLLYLAASALRGLPIEQHRHAVHADPRAAISRHLFCNSRSYIGRFGDGWRTGFGNTPVHEARRIWTGELTHLGHFRDGNGSSSRTLAGRTWDIPRTEERRLFRDNGRTLKRRFRVTVGQASHRSRRKIGQVVLSMLLSSSMPLSVLTTIPLRSK